MKIGKSSSLLFPGVFLMGATKVRCWPSSSSKAVNGNMLLNLWIQ